MSTEYDKTALMALPGIATGSSEEKGLLNWSRPYLFEQIRQNGVDVVVSRGAKAFDIAHTAAGEVVRPHYDAEGTSVSQIERLGTLGLNEFGVIRSIVQPMYFDVRVPQLNPPNARFLARDKYGIRQLVLGPANVYARHATSIVPDTTFKDVASRVEALPGDEIVAKPNSGQRSRGVIVGTKQEVINVLRDTPVTEPYILEEKLQFAHELPGIHGRTSDEDAQLAEANKNGVNREVRTYYFGKGEWDVVGRVAKVGETDFRSDEWLHLDLDSTMSTLIEGATQVISRLRRIIGTDELNVALDWVYASSASHPEPSWQVMELNAAEPQLVQLSEDMEVGRRQHDKMAKQISRIALS